jgi:hypothetical protein
MALFHDHFSTLANAFQDGVQIARQFGPGHMELSHAFDHTSS